MERRKQILTIVSIIVVCISFFGSISSSAETEVSIEPITISDANSEVIEGETPVVIEVKSPPVAQISYEPQLVYTNISINLQGSIGSDDERVVTYAWELNGDGLYNDAKGETIEFSYADDGVYTVGLKVTDTEGLSSTTSIEIKVLNNPPTAQIAVDLLNPEPGQTITLSGADSTDSDGSIVQWIWDLDNDGVFDDGSGRSITYTFSSEGTFPINLKVVDDDQAADIIESKITVVGYPRMEISPLKEELAEVYRGQNYSYPVQVTNTGTTDLNLNMRTEPEYYVYEGFISSDSDDLQYVWNDIRTKGFKLESLAHKLDSTQSLELSFDFNFMGRTFDQIYIGAKGYIALGKDNIIQNLHELPDSLIKGDLIVGFFSDAAPYYGGDVYVLDDGDQVIVQYNKVANYDHSKIYTYQMILKKSGDIYYYYKEMQGETQDGIIGYQCDLEPSVMMFNPALTSPGQVAIRMYPIDIQLNYPKSTLTLKPNETTFFYVTMQIAELNPGTYSRDLLIDHDAINLKTPLTFQSNVRLLNNPPVAAFNRTPRTVYVGDVVTLNGEYSKDPDGQIVSYQWDLDGDGQYDDAEGSVVEHIYLENRVETVGLKVSDQSGEFAEVRAEIVIQNMAPIAEFSYDLKWPEPGQPIKFDASSSIDFDGEITDYLWDFDGDGEYDDGKGEECSYTYTEPGTFHIALQILDDDGERVMTSPIDLKVAYQPKISVLPEKINLEVIRGMTETRPLFITNPGNADLEYTVLFHTEVDEQWMSSPEVSGTVGAKGTKTQSINFKGANLGNYSGQIEIQHNVLGVLPVMIPVEITVVNALPTATIYLPEMLYTGMITFDGSDSTDFDGEIAEYLWDFDGDGEFDDGTGAVITRQYADNGQYTVGLQVIDADGAIATKVIDFMVLNRVPKGGITYNKVWLDVNDEIIFDASGFIDSDGTISSYEWDFSGDGIYDDATGSTTVWTFSAPGKYPISIRITDDDGGQTENTIVVTVENWQKILVKPVAIDLNFSTGETAERTLTIENQGELDLTYEIKGFGKSTNAEQKKIPLILGSINAGTLKGGETKEIQLSIDTLDLPPDIYIVPLTITHNGIKMQNPILVPININIHNWSPTAKAIVNTLEAYTGDNFTFDASQSTDKDGMIRKYTWDFNNDGVFEDGYGSGISYSFAENGNYTVGLRVIDDRNGMDTTYLVVNVLNRTPAADYVYNPPYPSKGDDLQFDASDSLDYDGKIVSYTWDLDNDGQFDDASGKLIGQHFAQIGTYPISLKVTDDDGSSDIVKKYITISSKTPIPVITWTPIPPGLGIDITFSAVNSSDPDGKIVKYEWDLDNDGQYDDGQGITAVWKYTKPGDYLIRLKVTDDDGVTAVESMYLSFN